MFLQKFDTATEQAVWDKARIVVGYNAAIIRKDICGAWIKRAEYGNRDSDYGWEIDHISPTSKGGSNALSNLQPLHWQNNQAKGDGPLVCAVSAK